MTHRSSLFVELFLSFELTHAGLTLTPLQMESRFSLRMSAASVIV